MANFFFFNKQFYLMSNDDITHSDITNAQLKPIKTSEYLSKYEKAKVLGIRAMQIAQGAPFPSNLTHEKQLTDPLDIAEKELLAKSSPLIIRRILPNGEFEDVAVSELKIGK